MPAAHCASHVLAALLIALQLALAGAAEAGAASRSADTACERVKAQIRRVQSQMRSGYTARQGLRLEARLRELKKKRRRVCR